MQHCVTSMPHWILVLEPLCWFSDLKPHLAKEMVNICTSMRLINNPEIVHFLFPSEVRFCKIQENKRKIVIELPLQNLFDGQIFAQKSLLISFVSNLIFFFFCWYYVFVIILVFWVFIKYPHGKKGKYVIQ